MKRIYHITLVLSEQLYDDVPALDPLAVKRQLESLVDLNWPGDDLRVADITLVAERDA